MIHSHMRGTLTRRGGNSQSVSDSKAPVAQSSSRGSHRPHGVNRLGFQVAPVRHLPTSFISTVMQRSRLETPREGAIGKEGSWPTLPAVCLVKDRTEATTAICLPRKPSVGGSDNRPVRKLMVVGPLCTGRDRFRSPRGGAAPREARRR